MKKCKHEYNSDGGACLKCGKTLIDLLKEKDVIKSKTKSIKK